VSLPVKNPSGNGRQKMMTAVSADGTRVRAFDDGDGPAILVIHPGLDDGRSWAKVAARLSGRFRVIRIVRRHYRLDLPAAAYSITREVEDVLALAAAIGPPMLVVGHSSGAVVALEAMARAPATFAGAVLFEPPVATGPPDPSGAAAMARAHAAVADGKPGQAVQIFVRDIVGMPALSALLLRAMVVVMPRLRALVPRQITDLDGVGIRLDAYAGISTPTVLLGAERSPAHLARSLDALAAVMPNVEKVVLARRDHQAQQKAPGEVADVIQALAGRVIPAASYSS
jgi:pimeloyl-ACP methyl ester carboxylesterase